MKNIIGVVLILVSIIIFGFRISKGVELKQNCTGYLKRAAAANTIELAIDELSKSINYLESNNLTSGYTSLFIKTPDEDIDFWYRNLKASLNELQNLKSENAFVRTNVLIKLRETLVGSKSRVNVPEGLAVYPNNKLWALLMLISVICGFAGFVILIVEAEKKAKLIAEGNK